LLKGVTLREIISVEHLIEEKILDGINSGFTDDIVPNIVKDTQLDEINFKAGANILKEVNVDLPATLNKDISGNGCGAPYTTDNSMSAPTNIMPPAIVTPPASPSKTSESNVVPNSFTGMDLWIKQTNLCCWYCSNNFTTIPIPIPTYISKLQPDCLEMTTEGIFCSFSCAQAHINLVYNKDGSLLNKSNMLRTLYKHITGSLTYYIEQAPAPSIMKKYVGNSGIDAAEYIKKKSAMQLKNGVVMI
jgi:hypothetical protein